MGDDREDDLLSSGGTLTLDGKQALSYSRIRYVAMPTLSAPSASAWSCSR